MIFSWRLPCFAELSLRARKNCYLNVIGKTRRLLIVRENRALEYSFMHKCDEKIARRSRNHPQLSAFFLTALLLDRPKKLTSVKQLCLHLYFHWILSPLWKHSFWTIFSSYLRRWIVPGRTSISISNNAQTWSNIVVSSHSSFLTMPIVESRHKVYQSRGFPNMTVELHQFLLCVCWSSNV